MPKQNIKLFAKTLGKKVYKNVDIWNKLTSVQISWVERLYE